MTDEGALLGSGGGTGFLFANCGEGTLVRFAAFVLTEDGLDGDSLD